MAGKTTETTPDPSINMNQFASALAQAMRQSTREIREGDPEYRAMQEAQGWFDAFDGDVTVIQNAYEANPRGETAQVRYRAAHLKPGKYLKGRVGVSLENNGSVVRLSYPVRGDEMLKNRDYFSSFGDLINKIWDEQGGGPEPAYPPPAA